jgi:hypothetical protein
MLQAMRHWTIERIRMGDPVVHNDMTENKLKRILAQMVEEEEIIMMKPVPPPLPDKFMAFGKNWRAFSDGFHGHCAVTRGTMNLPLVYTLRAHEVPTQEEMRATAHATSDLCLMALVRLDSCEAQRDNTLVWQLLRTLVLDTPAWNYVKQHDATQNGRMAFLTHSIFQNPDTWEDFQKCYSFVETMERFHPSYLDPNSFDCKISDVS